MEFRGRLAKQRLGVAPQGDSSVQGTALAEATCWHYDAAGNTVVLPDAEGRPTYFEFDALDRQTREIGPLG